MLGSSILMSTRSSPAQLLRFDAFELDLRTAELRKRGIRVRLQGQPVQLLSILLRAAGDLVTREELRGRLWPADTFVDFDHSLHNAIARIREVLGDSAETPRYIETLPRRGYRFIAPVEMVPARRAPGGSARADGARRARPVRRTALVALAAGLCGALGVSTWAAWRLQKERAAGAPMRSIAVLPLGNLSGDATQEYFADGMTEQLISELSRIPGLKVISRTSVMEYKGTRKHLPQIAGDLGVDGIVEGSVRREGDQVRITVQLLDGPNDRHLWSGDYQRELQGVLALETEMAEAIAGQIRLQVSSGRAPGPRRAHSLDPEAYEAYRWGRFYVSTRFSAAGELEKARRYFEECIHKDPNFALGYVGLADTYVYLASFRRLSPEDAYKPARAALSKALELDPGLGEAHATLAVLSWQHERDWAAAEREFSKALELAPNDARLHANRSNYLSWSGRSAEALAEIRKSRELEPGYSFAGAESAARYLLRDYRGLLEAGRRGVASDPNEWLEHYFLGVGYEGVGRPTDAIREYQTAIALSGGDQDATAALAHAYARTGRKSEARRIAAELEERAKSSYVSPYMIATVYAGLGDKDRAFLYLDRADRERCWDIAWALKADLRFDPLRSDPRFEELLTRTGLRSAPAPERSAARSFPTGTRNL
jgi:TolB-like protein/DNA-binding winged helix-turn-helix (wHTH) protein/Flp pilus assembly protein TadD